MVVKTIVVRNLFSYEYDGSNPSLSTRKKNILKIEYSSFVFKKIGMDSKRRLPSSLDCSGNQ